MNTSRHGSNAEPSKITQLRDGFGRLLEGLELILEAVGPRMVRFRASIHSNSTPWRTWHLTWIQDDRFMHLARALDEESSLKKCCVARDWVTHLNLPNHRLDPGYGHNNEQVADFGMHDGEYLLPYHRDVHELAWAFRQRCARAT